MGAYDGMEAAELLLLSTQKIAVLLEQCPEERHGTFACPLLSLQDCLAAWPAVRHTTQVSIGIRALLPGCAGRYLAIYFLEYA